MAVSEVENHPAPSGARADGEPAPGERLGRAWNAAKMSSVGIEMAVATVVGWGIGTWLDHRLDTDPIFMLVFFCLGVAAGFKGLIRAAKDLSSARR